MAYAWQHLLSARPSKRTNVASDLSINGGEGGCILYEFPERDADGILAIKETHYIKYKSVKEGKSGPPMHIHLRQTETFQVLQGKLGITLNGKQMVLSKDSGRDTASVRPGNRHSFFPHPTSEEDVVFRVWLDPETGKDIDAGLDEAFMRNFATYLADCERAGMGPSLFQLLVFLWHADVILSPPFWMPLFLLRALHYMLAHVVGELVLGYRPSYPEYAHSSGSVKSVKGV